MQISWKLGLAPKKVFFSETFDVSGVFRGGCLYVFALSCSLLSKYLPISWKQRKEQSHAQCHVTQRNSIFDKISEHVKIAKSTVPEGPITERWPGSFRSPEECSLPVINCSVQVKT